MADNMTPTQGSAPRRDIRELLRNGLGDNSQHALAIALQLLDVDGVGGVLVLRIPERKDAKCEASFTVGKARVTLDQPR